MNTLTLKWGTLKAWRFPNEDTKVKFKALCEEYEREGGLCVSAAAQKDTPRQKEIICEFIDLVDDPKGVYLDWDGKYVSKDEAKEYVRSYGKEKSPTA